MPECLNTAYFITFHENSQGLRDVNHLNTHKAEEAATHTHTYTPQSLSTVNTTPANEVWNNSFFIYFTRKSFEDTLDVQVA